MVTINVDGVDGEYTEEQERHWAQTLERRRRRLQLYASLEARLGIPTGFIDKMESESSDWGYIVKYAVLCEAAVTHAVVLTVREDANLPIWFDHISTMNNSKRLELAEKLGVISNGVKLQLKALAEIRNSFAHEVSNFGGSLSTYFANCSLDKKRDLSSKLLGIPHGNDMHWGFYIANTRLLISVGMAGPIKALATIGLGPDEVASLDREWELADMYREIPQ